MYSFVAPSIALSDVFCSEVLVIGLYILLEYHQRACFMKSSTGRPFAFIAFSIRSYSVVSIFFRSLSLESSQGCILVLLSS